MEIAIGLAQLQLNVDRYLHSLFATHSVLKGDHYDRSLIAILFKCGLIWHGKNGYQKYEQGGSGPILAHEKNITIYLNGFATNRKSDDTHS